MGASGLSGAGGRITDYLLANHQTGNVTLVEIKTPHTPLLGKIYRGTYPVSEHLSGAVAQVLIQRNELMKNFYMKHYFARGQRFEVDAPQCVVILGSAENELADPAKAAAFEIQREALAGRVRLMTFDELYGRFSTFNMVT